MVLCVDGFQVAWQCVLFGLALFLIQSGLKTLEKDLNKAFPDNALIDYL